MRCKGKFTEGRVVIARGWEWGQWGWLLINGYRASVGEDEKVLERDGDGCTTVGINNVTEL